MNTDFIVATEIVDQKLRETDKIPLFLAISGSHSCGLEQSGSDIDIRGIYLDSTEKVLSLHPGDDNVEGSVSVAVLPKIDYQCYEVKKAFNMLLNNNGNIVRLLLNLPFRTYIRTNLCWYDIAKRFLTKKLRNYYSGYAHAQKKRAMSCRGGKALVYTYREIFEGIFLMENGYLEMNFNNMWDYMVKKNYYTEGLLYKAIQDRHMIPTYDQWKEFECEWERLCGILDIAAEHSRLPDKHNGYDYLNNELVRLRGVMREGV